MSTKMISKASIMAYLHQLECDEKASATIEKYRHDINLFYEFLPDEKVLTKEEAIRYKQYLIEKGYAATSINSMLVAMNSLDRKSTRLNYSHITRSRMPSSA